MRQAFGALQAEGLAPAPRGGHACARLGSTLLVFGGADRCPKAYDDLWQLELGEHWRLSWLHAAVLSALLYCYTGREVRVHCIAFGQFSWHAADWPTCWEVANIWPTKVLVDASLCHHVCSCAPGGIPPHSQQHAVDLLLLLCVIEDRKAEWTRMSCPLPEGCVNVYGSHLLGSVAIAGTHSQLHCWHERASTSSLHVVAVPLQAVDAILLCCFMLLHLIVCCLIKVSFMSPAGWQ